MAEQTIVSEAIGLWFGHPHAKLCPAHFDQLWIGAPRETTRFPYCVMTLNESALKTRTRQSEYHTQAFTLEIPARTEEIAEGLEGLVMAALRDKEEEITAATGLQIVSLEMQSNPGTEQVALDLWVATVRYKCQYVIGRQLAS